MIDANQDKRCERNNQIVEQLINKKFTYQDLLKIIEIKDRVIHSLLVGGGGALFDDEEKTLNELLNKAKALI